MDMKNIATTVLSLTVCLLPMLAAAQVDKRVEVTKNYQPVVSGAMKLPVEPDMADTVKMRPEIEYGITPLMYSTELVTAHTFKPATVTYWDFNRPTNFYLKLGAGYPINTVGDFYMSTYNVRTGYIMAAANHYGEFGKSLNRFDDRRNAMKASTKARVAGGVCWGRHMFEGELSYGSEVARRYAAPLSFYPDGDPGTKAEYEDFGLKLRLGDDFQDLSRTNFNVELYGSFFHDKSDWLEADYKLQQFDFGADARVGRRFGRHYVEGAARYSGIRGIKELASNTDNQITAGLRYGYSSRVVELSVGADYSYDKSASAGKSYILPCARILLNVTNNDAVIPFVEFETRLSNNDYYSLARRTVYLEFNEAMNSLPNTLGYELQAGLSGKFARGRIGYRLYAGMSFEQNGLYWYNVNYEWMNVVTARKDMLSLNLELDYRPIDELVVSAGVHGRFFKDYAELNGVAMGNGESPLDGFVKLRYRHRKFSAGLSARFCGAAEWCCVVPAETVRYDALSPSPVDVYNVSMPAYVDLGVDFEWNLKPDWKIFVEGSNLANMKIYNLAYFRERGIGCTAGFKFTF